MAYSICSSSFTVSPDHHFFSISPSNPPPRLVSLRTSTHLRNSLQISLVSLQESQTHNPETLIQENSQRPDGKTGTLSNSYIWVNPKSRRAAHLRKKSYDSRYRFLVAIAESLNSCVPVEDSVYTVLDKLSGNIVEQDAVIILNNMSNPETAPLVLRYFQGKLKVVREFVLYNVCLKVFRKCKDLPGAENLFDEMLQRGVKPDNVTFSTIISCCRICSMPAKAVEWFEKMPSYGVEPDDVTYSVMIDAYGRAGNVEMALTLFDRARTEKWRIDCVTFSTVIRILGRSGNFDGCLNVYEEMKALGVKPNLVLYNNMFDAMGRAKRPWQVKTIYEEMISNGFSPGWVTYAALLRAYGRARYGEDAMIVYREMKEKGLSLNVLLYNTLLSMCADLGFVDEGAEIYEDMKRSESCQPDSYTFSSLITIYSCSGKVLETEAILSEMKDAGFEPTIYIFTSLIQCYGKANRTDDVVKTLDKILELGITPDERLCCCLLSVMTQTPAEEFGKLTRCIEKANSKLGNVVSLLVQGEKVEKEIFLRETRDLMDSIGDDVKKPYCNCLIDLSVNLDLLERACQLLDLGLTLEIYSDIQLKTPENWSLHLKSLSLGAALTAVHIWMNDLSKAIEEGEELPSVLGINTGHGKHKYQNMALAGVFNSYLQELDAPFHEVPERPGWFLTTQVAAKSWLESRRTNVAVSA